MRIGIDCDGVLRDLIPAIVEGIKATHPEHADKILEPTLGIGNNGYHFGLMQKLKSISSKITI